MFISHLSYSHALSGTVRTTYNRLWSETVPQYSGLRYDMIIWNHQGIHFQIENVIMWRRDN